MGGVAPADIRELDWAHYIAVFQDGEWNSLFGGSFTALLPPDILGDGNVAKTLIARHNAKSNKWTFTRIPGLAFVVERL